MADGRNYGRMMGYDDAIAWIKKNTPEVDEKAWVLARMNYEHDKSIPIKPVFRKGIYGKKYDEYTCRHCGRRLDIIYDYCPKCGTEVKWDSTRCLTGHDEKGEEER